MRKSALLIALTGAVALAAAQPVTYAPRRTQIKAGVLLIASQQVGGELYNPVPHHWVQLDRNVRVKPSGWTLINPLGQTQLNGSAGTRWAANPSAGAIPALGTRLRKEHAPYWEVLLAETSNESLAQFDVLSLTVTTSLSLNPLEREKLRTFVDGGGILWVDFVNDTGTPVADFLNTAPFPFELLNAPGAQQANLEHPLLRYPNAFTLGALNRASDPGTLGTVAQFVGAGTLAPHSGLFSPLVQNSRKMEAVAGNGSGRTVAIGKIGDGLMVLTSIGATATLSRGQGPVGTISPNRTFTSSAPTFDQSYDDASKLAINIISAAQFYGGDSTRGANSSSGKIDAPLMRRYEHTGIGGALNGQKPIIFKGRAIYARGNTLSVYDAQPDRDLDRDGDPDDGFTDTLNYSADLIWQSTVGANLSGPVAIESSDTTLGGPDQVWVTDGSGNLHAFDLDSSGLGVAPLVSIAPPSASAGNSNQAPVIQDGRVYVADTTSTGFGRLWVAELRDGTVAGGANPYAVSGSSRLPQISAEPAVGYIPIQDGSGGLDLVAYCATAPAAGRSAGLTSVWIGARGESPVNVRFSGGNIRLQTRAALQGLHVIDNGTLPHLNQKLTVLFPNGDPFQKADYDAHFSGNTSSNQPGELLFEINGGSFGAFDWDGTSTPGDPTDDPAYRLDYTIDWTRVSAGVVPADSVVRGNLLMPDSAANSSTIVGAPAITSEGHVIVATDKPTAPPAAAIYNFREEGRGDFALVYRYDFVQSLTMRLNGQATNTFNYPGTFADEDDLLTSVPFLNLPLTRYRINQAPAVKGDTVFVAVNAIKSFGFGDANTTVLVALEAHPGPVEFFGVNLQENNNQISLVQPDPIKSTNTTNPELVSVLPRSRFSIESVPSAPAKKKVVINSMMANSRGPIRDAISTSLPVYIRGTNATDTVIEPEATGATGYGFGGTAAGRWSPVRWYSVMNGVSANLGLFVAGDTVYVGGLSVLPSILRVPFAGFRNDIMLMAFDRTVDGNSKFLKSTSVKPWQQQLSLVRARSATPFDFDVADAVQWPQFKGVGDIDDLRVRVAQASLLGVNQVYGMAIGGESLALNTGVGVFGFDKANFLVADQGRVSSFDAAGNPRWALSQTQVAGVNQAVGSASLTKDIADPVRLYPDGDNGNWIVDRGADRLAFVDRAGRELRSVESFRVHPSLAPEGFRSGSTTKLKGPRDIFVFSEYVSQANVAAAFPGETLSDPAGDELWRHIIVADAGNHRVVELLDRYRIDANRNILGVVRYADPAQPNPVAALGVLYWHSPTELTGSRFAYNSISRVFADNGGGLRPIVALGFGNLEPGRATVGLDSAPVERTVSSGFGGVVLYDGPSTLVLSEFEMPAIPAGAYLGPDGFGGFAFNSAARPAGTRKIAGLQSVTLREISTVGGRRIAVMIADASGVFELVQPDPVGDPDRWIVNWMLPREAYLSMRRPGLTGPYTPAQLGDNPTEFRPMHARRLDSGDVLIVNGFAGSLRDGSSFGGEVFTVWGLNDAADTPGFNLADPNLGFQSMSVTYELPPVQGIRELIRPVYADRR